VAIAKAFDKIEDEFLNVAKFAFNAGFPKSAYVGSCALVAVVVDNKLYVANSGDCKGVLIR
jgi:serine/threonine protein phosphatase PrpC